MEGSHREAAETYTDVEPHNNSILFFPSYVLHEVLPIRCPSGAFADGRFTLNGWVLDDSIQVEQFAKEEASEESVAG
jgi:SM-20-related protein